VKLKLERLQKDPDVTIGSLSIDGEWECWSLEDAIREPKVHGETAIPFGLYGVDITYSPRFQRDLPLLLNVSGFAGVRIHPGNTASDTEGCVLVGQDRMGKSIGHSRAAFELLFTKIKAAKVRGEPITLEIV
jgi:hypothetical protein